MGIQVHGVCYCIYADIRAFMHEQIDQLIAGDCSCASISRDSINTTLVQLSAFIHGELCIVYFANSVLFMAFKMACGSIQTF